MQKHSISVVIPNYNGRFLFEQNLPLLYHALKTYGGEYEVIIPDDCSKDDSVSFLQKNYPEVIIIESEKNYGFATNVNKGIFKAKNDLVFILNSDVALFPDYFLPCERYFNRPDTFGVMGRIINQENDLTQDGAKYPVFSGISLKSTLNYLPLVHNENQTLPSLFLSGANAIVRREMLQELGGFDELFSPFYMEDVDLSVRAWRLGWKCYYEHMAICRHPASTTIKSHHTRRWIKTISVRNRLMFHHLHLQGFKRLLWLFVLIFKLMFKGILLEAYYIKGFTLYIDSIKNIKISKRRFSELTKKYKGSKSLREVCREIQQLIGKVEIKKF